MHVFENLSDPRLLAIILNGGIAVLRTDTLYGIVARADDEQAVHKVYQLKKRNPSKPCIILLDQPSSAYGHGDELNHDDRLYGSETPTSFLINALAAPSWLLRDGHELAYRIPHHSALQALLRQTGPLIAPSANPEGLLPAGTLQQAINYFGESVDAYVEGGTVPVDTAPSRIIRIDEAGHAERLR